MKRLLSLMLLACLPAALCSAAVLLSPVAGGLDLQVVSDPGFTSISVFDIRSSVLVDVLDPGSLGVVIITDGTLFGGSAPASPNSQLLVSNFINTELLLATFSNARFGGSGVLLDATFAPLTGVTDPGLAAILAGAPFVFDFAPVAQTDLGGAVLTQLAFVSATGTEAIPEPASAALLVGGLAVFALARRRSAKAQR